jgi:integrase
MDDCNTGRGYYDPTLVKYGLGDGGQKPSDLTTVELFDRFTKYKQKYGGSSKALSKESIGTHYKYMKVMLEKHLNIPAYSVDKRAIDAFTLVCQKLKPDTAKQRIWLLKAAWDWGRDKFQLPGLKPVGWGSQKVRLGASAIHPRILQG